MAFNFQIPFPEFDLPKSQTVTVNGDVTQITSAQPSVFALSGSIPDYADFAPIHPPLIDTALWADGINKHCEQAKGLQIAVPFWERSGLTFQDWMNNESGTMVDSEWAIDTIGPAIKFNDAYAKLPPSPSLAFQTTNKGIAVSCWVKFLDDFSTYDEETPSVMVFAATQNAGGEEEGQLGFYLALNYQQEEPTIFGRFHWSPDGEYEEFPTGVSAGSGLPVTDHKWYHVVFQSFYDAKAYTYAESPDDQGGIITEMWINGNLTQSYIDGSIGVEDTIPAIARGYLSFGDYLDINGEPEATVGYKCNCMIRDFRIYNRRLGCDNTLGYTSGQFGYGSKSEIDKLIYQSHELYQPLNSTKNKYYFSTTDIEGSGGVEASGEATVETIILTVGGVEISGEAIVDMPPVAGGGVEVGSSATNQMEFNYIASGGLLVSSPVFGNGYTYRVLVTVPALANVEDFPLPVNVVLASDVGEQLFMATDTDDNELPLDFVSFDTDTNRLKCFVKLNLTDSGTSFYLYYGRS